ncbi:IS3 family transposase [Spiroplasma alleghenense]|uniref:IS3 family transposase n=1 Tax=Spiroplasma alleghenense TaxID=216931 RepID=UPI001FE6963F|nr:IS3 family transposase [Spiroplasma alleghenense]
MWPVSFICKILKTTQSSYYRWVKNNRPNFNYKIDQELLDLIESIFQQYKEIYGYPRIRIVLKNQYNISVSGKKVYRYMQELGIKSKTRIKKKRKPKEVKILKNRKHENIVNRKWNKYSKGELFVTDVSFLPFSNNRFAYLSILKDVSTGFIVGYDVSLRNDNKIYLKTLKMAESYFDFDKNIIIHSDNGFQYTSDAVEIYCSKNNIKISLSRPGNSVDNAVAESFFACYKTEWFRKNFKTYSEVYNNFIDYINFYNFNRVMIKHEKTPWQAWSTL